MKTWDFFWNTLDHEDRKEILISTASQFGFLMMVIAVSVTIILTIVWCFLE